MSAGSAPALWPALDPAAYTPTLTHLHHLTQIAGKYTLDLPFEPNWGTSPLPVTSRGYTTPLLRAGDVLFTIDFELLDDRVTITASTGRATLPLAAGSVADFYARFVAAATPLGVPAPRTLTQPEIPGAPLLSEDTEERPYDPAVAHGLWAALAGSSAALSAWQAPFEGHRPRVGIMWGALDLSATRYNGRPVQPSAEMPVFQQNGMSGEVVAVGLTFGDEFHGRDPSFYAYISPPPDGLEDFDFGVPEAKWMPDAGLITLPWDAVRASEDPHGTVVRFADGVYAAAVGLGGWPDDLLGPRCDGWYAAAHPLRGS